MPKKARGNTEYGRKDSRKWKKRMKKVATKVDERKNKERRLTGEERKEDC